jgi:purine-nucleoside phosphorylase
MGTPHITALPDQIAPVVLMPGDPLRAKYIADNYLQDVVCFNTVRNMFGFTGFYHGKRISVMGSGMGMPSIGIYSFELFKFYNVDTIIRIGTCGASDPKVPLLEVMLADSAYSESSFGQTQNGNKDIFKYPSQLVNDHIIKTAQALGIKMNIGRIHSTDVFYTDSNYRTLVDVHREFNCIGTEMESFALFHNADQLGKRAACILTVSDNVTTHEETSPQQRESALHEMIRLALEAATTL